MGSISTINVSVPQSCFRDESFWFSVSVQYDNDESSSEISNGFLIPGVNDTDSSPQNLITLVLVVTMDDISRMLLLFESLKDQCGMLASCSVHEMLVYVPDSQVNLISTVIDGYESLIAFRIRTIGESEVFGVSSATIQSWIGHGVNTYALQMAIKILCSQFISTEFYITLDADVILLNSFDYNEVVIPTAGGFRGIYHDENRFLHHPEWYSGSEKYLGMFTRDPDSQGFGVTPVVMSTYGSLVTLATILDRVDETCLDFDCSNNDPIFHWLYRCGKNGVMWTEYTLYRVVLDHFQLFHLVHISEEEASTRVRLHCENVWYRDQLPWNSRKAFDSSSRKCLFSVIQSTTNIQPSIIYRQYLEARANVTT